MKAMTSKPIILGILLFGIGINGIFLITIHEDNKRFKAVSAFLEHMKTDEFRKQIQTGTTFYVSAFTVKGSK